VTLKNVLLILLKLNDKFAMIRSFLFLNICF